jgi:uncharacterized membrane protein
MDPVMQVILWWVAFAGTHTLLTHPPIRSALVARLGTGPFQGLFSLVAFATFVPLVWTFFAHRTSTAMPLPRLAQTPGIWWLTMILMFVALELVVLAFARPNPLALTARTGFGAGGILRVTRHPAFMGAALFGLAHLLVNPRALERAFFGGALVYSILGSAHQDWRKRLEKGPEMERFYAETSFLPFVAIAAGRTRFEPREIGGAAFAIGAILYAVVFVFHDRWFG